MGRGREGGLARWEGERRRRGWVTPAADRSTLDPCGVPTTDTTRAAATGSQSDPQRSVNQSYRAPQTSRPKDHHRHHQAGHLPVRGGSHPAAADRRSGSPQSAEYHSHAEHWNTQSRHRHSRHTPHTRYRRHAQTQRRDTHRRDSPHGRPAHTARLPAVSVRRGARHADAGGRTGRRGRRINARGAHKGPVRRSHSAAVPHIPAAGRGCDVTRPAARTERPRSGGGRDGAHSSRAPARDARGGVITG